MLEHGIAISILAGGGHAICDLVFLGMSCRVPIARPFAASEIHNQFRPVQYVGTKDHVGIVLEKHI